MESIVKQILSSEATSLLEIDHTARRDVSWVFFLLSAGSFFVYLLSFVV
ncbi:MAG: hypothetical protein H6767_00230 [Candidatus Peribacteria bacterium]|nr:MAG: hypothetical protein H6767_00230 [Candidatus Peribacteria bacterium]